MHGVEFSAALASVDGIDVRDAERCCDALARRGQILRAAGEAAWPDGTVEIARRQSAKALEARAAASLDEVRRRRAR